MPRHTLSPKQDPFLASKIIEIRGHRVMLDRDLAEIYGVPTKRLNEQVKRNKARFPIDFMFQLTKMEKDKVVAMCDHLSALKFSSTFPYAFTEHGALMIASILNTDIAVRASLQVVRTFIQLREIVISHKDLAQKINELERKYDSKFKVVFEALKELMTPSQPKRKSIGFRVKSSHEFRGLQTTPQSSRSSGDHRKSSKKL